MRVGRRQQASAQRVVGLQKLCLWAKVGHKGQREIVRAGWRSGGGQVCAGGRAGWQSKRLSSCSYKQEALGADVAEVEEARVAR